MRNRRAGAAEQTRRNAPAVVQEVEAELDAVREVAAGLLAEVARATEAADAAQRERVAAAQAEHDQAEAAERAAFKELARGKRAEVARVAEAERADLERKVAALWKELEERQAVRKDAVELEVAEAQGATERRLDALDAALEAARLAAQEARDLFEAQIAGKREERSRARERVATLQEQAEAATKGRAMHELAAQYDAEAEELRAQSDRLTAAINRLDALQRSLADDLPIEGLEIAGREVKVNGIPFDQLNTAQKVAVAVKVATLRARLQRLPVVFVDGAEALDREHFDALVSELAAAGVQAFVARVEDHALEVKTA
jgi:colicin import membrane protein